MKVLWDELFGGLDKIDMLLLLGIGTFIVSVMVLISVKELG